MKEINGFHRYLEHWSLLVRGFYLLQKNYITKDKLLIADQLLREFIEDTEYYHTKYAITFNLHQETHFSQSGAVSQVCRNLSMKENTY